MLQMALWTLKTRGINVVPIGAGFGAHISFCYSVTQFLWAFSLGGF